MACQPIHPDQLVVGLYVRLDLPWTEHGFFSSSFKIKSEKQIAKLKGLKLEQILYDPDRSEAQPLALEGAPPAQVAVAETAAPAVPPAVEETPDLQGDMRDQRQRLNRGRKRYGEAAGKVRKIMQGLMSQPERAAAAAGEIVGDMVSDLVDDPEASVHLVNLTGMTEGSYYHAINVTILSLMLGKQLGLERDDLTHLGTGALFHDIGHSEVPPRILRKPPPLTKAEEDFMAMHPEYGARIAKRMGALPAPVIEIIEQHHEMVDGSGYPKQLKGEQISRLARIVAVVNAYDNLCNPLHSGPALSPYEAMSLLFSKQKTRLDQAILAKFIASMGVYPPGTVVRLTNGAIAIVLSVNPGALLKPVVLVYDPDVPKSDATILDLQREQGLQIKESVRRSALAPAALEYLDLTGSVSYIFESGEAKR